MENILRYDQFINEQESSPALKAGEIVTEEDGEKKDKSLQDQDDKESTKSKLVKKSAEIDKDVEEEDVDKKNMDLKPSAAGADSSSGATSGDSDVRSPTSTEVRSPTSTRTEVRSPTSTETSTDAYTSGNVTVTGGAGDGANTTVHIHSKPENYKRLKSGEGRKKHMPSAVAMAGPNDKKSY